jgi:hypothetical protein
MHLGSYLLGIATVVLVELAAAIALWRLGARWGPFDRESPRHW